MIRVTGRGFCSRVRIVSRRRIEPSARRPPGRIERQRYRRDQRHHDDGRTEHRGTRSRAAR